MTIKNNNRIKTSVGNPEIPDKADTEKFTNQIAQATHNRRKLEAQMDFKITQIKEEYALRFNEIDEHIKNWAGYVQLWAEANPQEFAKKKSVEFPSATVGFRTGTPSLKLLSKAWNWEKVLLQVQALLPNFVVGKPEIDKRGILLQANELGETVAQCGMKVVQDESFFVDPIITETDTKATAPTTTK